MLQESMSNTFIITTVNSTVSGHRQFPVTFRKTIYDIVFLDFDSIKFTGTYDIVFLDSKLKKSLSLSFF